MTWPNYSASCIKEVSAILRKGGSLSAYLANGKRLEPREDSQAWRLEREIERKFGVRHAIAVNSGTGGLHAGLVALGVAGKEVITSPFTFSATASAILLAGGTPRFADVDPHTFCITKETVAPLVNSKTAAIVPVDLFGYLPDLSGLLALGVPLLEDACQSVGAVRDGRFAGTVGVGGCYSFNGSKNVPAGEGGCFVTNDSAIAEKARLLVNHGENFKSESVGYNYRIHELVACVARHGLRELEERNQRRRDLAKIAAVRLPMLCPKSCKDRSSHGHVSCWGGQHSNELVTPHGPYKEPIVGASHHVYYVLPMLVFKDRSAFIARCAKRGLPIQQSYTTPLHRLRAFKKYATRKLPVVDELHDKTLCLLTTLSPDRPLSYAKWCAKIIRESLE